ncbi:MAG: YihY family inner membrane protein [Tahibacter sp.]
MRYDRDRLNAFVLFLWQRFSADRCPQSAGALAYTTLFALVPLTAAVLGILAAFPVFQEWRSRLTDFVFDNFVPSAGKAVQAYLTQFADNASQATAVGVVVLLFSAISLMASIEDAFNRIWRVQTARGAGSRFLMYWTALSFGPLLLVAAMAISSYLFALPLLDQAETGLGLKSRFLGILPFLIVWFALLTSYLIIPNRSVRWRDAMIGALLGACLFEGAKRGFAAYLGSLNSYEQVYGTLAVFPIFLIWIYISWLTVLLGASVTAAISAFEYRRLNERLALGHEFYGLLRVMHHFVQAQRRGQGLRSADLCRNERFLTDDLLQRYLGDLRHAGMLQRSESGEWVLSRNLESASVLDLYESGLYRLPIGAAAVEQRSDDLPPRLRALFAELATNLRKALDVPLSEIFRPDPRSDPATPPDTVQESA